MTDDDKRAYVLLSDGRRLYIEDSKPADMVECPACGHIILATKEDQRRGWTCRCGANLVKR